MKKSLSLILAIAMVFSMFASVAFAAETTGPKNAQEMFEALKAKGIFEGINEAGDAGLDQDMNRAQAAKILVKLAGLTEDTASAASFKDLEGDEEWAIGFIGAAKKAGLMEGTAEGKFAPADKFTIEELATVLVRFLKLDVKADATVKGEVSDWAKGYVAAAIEAKVIAEAADYTIPAVREILVTSAFASYGLANKPVQAAELKATGAKKLEVKFAAAIDDAKAEFEVKKGAGVVPVGSKKVSEDKKTVELTLTTALTEGEYTVAVKNVFEEAKNLSVKVVNEHVAKIEILSDTAASVFDSTYTRITSATVSFKATNQYGEDVTTSAALGQTIQFNSTYGSASIDSTNKNTVVLNPGSGAYFQRDQILVLTGLKGTVVASKQIKIGDKSVATTITVKEVFNKDKKELKTNSTFADFALLIEAKDQYGNTVKAAQLKNDVAVFSSNPSVANIHVDSLGKGEYADNLGANSDKLGIKLAAPNGQSTDSNFEGTATITFVPVYGGAQVKFDVEVKKAAILDTITLSAPATVIGQNETVTVPFTAVDQFGNELKAYGDLNGKVSLGSGLTWDKDHYNGNAILKYTAPATKGIQILIATAPKTAKTSTVQVEVKDAKVPTTVAQLKDATTALAVGAEATIKASNIVVFDQYGLAYDLGKFFDDGYTFTVSVDNTSTVTVDGTTSGNITAKDDNSGTTTVKENEVTVKGIAKGDKQVKIEIVKPVSATQDVYNLTPSYKVVAKADIASYEVAEIAPIHNASTHTVDVDVKGVLSDGTKVVLPLSQYTVSASVYGTTVTGKTINAAGVSYASGDAAEKKGIAVVVVDGKDGAVTITKDIVVTNVAPVITKVNVAAASPIEMKDGVALANASDVTVTNLLKLFTAKDQYGKDINILNPFLTFTSLSDADKDAGALTAVNGQVGTASITNVQAGDSFSVTVVTQNGILTTVKVLVKKPIDRKSVV